MLENYEPSSSKTTTFLWEAIGASKIDTKANNMMAKIEIETKIRVGTN